MQYSNRGSAILYSTALAGMAALLLTSRPAQAAVEEDINPSELVNLSLEQLGNIEVTSVSKRAEKASNAAAAIFVVTNDDIRRTGATSIPEVLRIVPGLSVAQSGSHQWAISSRGSNDQFANKLLVLIDGRTVYTPFFSGVFWDVQDVPMQDIERIEVIRGPGATLWGANAVNGVINIITKEAKYTQGGLASASAGSFVNSMNTVRYGAKVDENAYMRVYAKYDDYGQSRNMTEGPAQDRWNKAQTGFRADWKRGEADSFTLQGDAYRAKEDYLFNLPLPTPAFNMVLDEETNTGGNLLGRWEKRFSADSNFTLQGYFDNARRSDIAYASNINTFDLDMQHVWTGMERHEIVWGGNYRMVDASFRSTPYFTFTTDDRQTHLFSAFMQDRYALIRDKVFLTLGSKFEHNSFTAFEYQPSARLSWLIDEDQTLWGSVSRAVRTPNIATDILQVVVAPLGAGVLGARQGDRNSDVEKLVAYELGYRVQPTKETSLDIAAFYSDYEDLVLGSLGAPIGPVTTSIGTYLVSPVLPVNMGTAHSWGTEITGNWTPTRYLELAASYTLLQIEFDQADPFGLSFTGKSPQQQFNLRSTVQLPHDVEFNSTIYYVDNLASLGIDDYIRFDARLAWKPLPSLELSIVGQNLLDPSHQEFAGFLYQNNSQIPRSVYANVTWKF